MTTPSDPRDAAYDPLVGDPGSESMPVRHLATGSQFEPLEGAAAPAPPPPPVAGTEPRGTVAGYPAVTTTGSGTEAEVQPAEALPAADGGSGKVKLAAVLAGAAALANKVRKDAPRKVQELREKRVTGRCVILSEVDGRIVAVGPYPDGEVAQKAGAEVAGGFRVVELVSPNAWAARGLTGVEPASP